MVCPAPPRRRVSRRQTVPLQTVFGLLPLSGPLLPAQFVRRGSLVAYQRFPPKGIARRPASRGLVTGKPLPIFLFSLLYCPAVIKVTLAMAAFASEADFIVWGIDQTPYGPVELPTLVAWVKDERVTADTWIFAGKSSSWQKASDMPELQLFF